MKAIEPIVIFNAEFCILCGIPSEKSATAWTNEIRLLPICGLWQLPRSSVIATAGGLRKTTRGIRRGEPVVVLGRKERELMKRKPDFVVERDGIAYLNRWWIWRRNRWLNCYLHQFIADDVDPVLHDHPWWSVSIVLKGGYYEITTGPDGTQQRRFYGRGSVRFRSAKFAHRIELPRVKRFDGEKTVEVLEPCWTLFLTGPRIRDWGFHCPNGWKSWQDYCEPGNPGRVGKGCGE